MDETICREEINNGLDSVRASWAAVGSDFEVTSSEILKQEEFVSKLICRVNCSSVSGRLHSWRVLDLLCNRASINFFFFKTDDVQRHFESMFQINSFPNKNPALQRVTRHGSIRLRTAGLATNVHARPTLFFRVHGIDVNTAF